MSNIDKRALREAAEKATPGPWYVHDKPCEDGNYGIDSSDKEFLAEAVVWWGFSRQSIWREEDAKHIAAANPAAVLALLDELEAKDAQIANLTAERDALREGEMGDAKHSNTRAAADIYFQLVEECEIPAGGSLVEYISDLRERAAAGKGE
ncbi:ead/Ea22-like family protein [Enterobacter hormaechei]|nr:ead/Ea22-like family protein [Enterobacter hormaechei]